MNKTARAVVLFLVVLCVAAASILGAWVLATHEHSRGYGRVEKHACPVCVQIATCRGLVAAVCMLLILSAASAPVLLALRMNTRKKLPALLGITLFALGIRLNN